VHHTVPDRDEAGHIVRQLVERDLQRRAVIGDHTLTDPLDDPVGHGASRICVDHCVFQR
jgi:hypothetical protein